ncbi:MAG: glycosyltransferase family 4 protein [Muribaculum sp.]|nr:glycosyltransferase family 4 protein [Muribaculum sp.]
MKIIYILSGTYIAGGATKSFLTMLRAAVDAGHEVAVVCCDENGVAQYLKSIGVTTLVFPYRFASLPPVSATARDVVRFIPRFFRDRVENYKAAKSVLGFAKVFKPDIIHENTSVTGIGGYVAKRLDIPHIIHIREYADKDFRIYLLNYRRRLRYGKVYPVAITRDLASYRCDSLGISRKAMVIYNGIIEGSSICYNPEKSPYFLYAGRVEPTKGIEDLIDAYIQYRKETIDPREKIGLKVAGTCNNKTFHDMLKRKLSAAGYADDIEWLGECTDMNNLYSKAAATVIPSKFEGFGRIAPEAMANGSLCVMRNTGGLKEQMDNGVDATGGEIALRFDTIEELALLLKKIAEDFAIRGGSGYTEMIQRSQSTVRKLYTKKVYCENILKLYNDIYCQQG